MLSQVLRERGSENAHGCAQDAENGFGFYIFRAILQSVPVHRKFACESLNMFFVVDISEQLLKLNYTELTRVYA
jgi:hypothetical protein